VKAIGMPELGADPRFATNTDRMKNLKALVPILGDALKKKPSAHWVSVFEAEGVPVGPVNKTSDMVADPQVKAREMVIEVDHPKAGRVKAIGHPVKFSETRAEWKRPAPLLGQHTREVLKGLGYDDARIDALASDGAIRCA
jgi:crotonobetainyl-CoA:carnitine CoA-transferase CaiB-like acyl-CoA transferase